MSWYRGSIITDGKGHPKIDYQIIFDRLLSKIRQLEEDHVKLVSKINLNTKTCRGWVRIVVEEVWILLIQENHAVKFAVVIKKIYRLDCLEKIKESFWGLLFEGLYYFTFIEDYYQRSFFRFTDRVLSYDAEL